MPASFLCSGTIRTDFLDQIVDKPWFENFILFCIIISSLMMAFEGADPTTNPFRTYFLGADLIFTFIFITECALRIGHKGFLFTNVACECQHVMSLTRK